MALLVGSNSHEIQTTWEPIVALTDSTKGPKRSTPFTLIQVDHTSPSEYVGAIRKTSELWKEVLKERLKASSERDHDGKDEQLVSNCKRLLSYLKDGYKKFEKGKQPDPSGTTFIALLVDDDKNIQAISEVMHVPNQLYINVLLSAPWNLKMNSKVPEPHASRSVMHAGTTMMRGLYRIAQAKMVPELRLTPMPHSDSATFYKERCGMVAGQGDFAYTVDPHTVPEKIKDIPLPVM